MNTMKEKRRLTVRRWTVYVAVAAVLGLSAGTGQAIILTGLDLVRLLQGAAAGPHGSQAFLVAQVMNGQPGMAFDAAFKRGDKLFDTELNAVDGVGANVGGGARFTHVPRADLTAPTEWASHLPPRTTGPNATSCVSCHGLPARDGGGFVAANVLRDPLRSGNPARFIERNAPHLFGAGGVQRLAEEMTAALQALRAGATAEACANGQASRDLVAKGVHFGRLSVTRTAAAPCQVQVSTAEVSGVGADLVVRPFQWKGSVASLREFSRKAANDELGLQAVELVGAGIDADFDGVADELSVGDVTSLAVYVAAQPRPTTRVELASLGLIAPLLDAEKESIARGGPVFRQIGCASCHIPRLTLDDPLFTEPSRNPSFRDAVFPAGQDPVAEGVDPAFPISFDLTKGQPDNVIKTPDGRRILFRLGSFRQNAAGKTVVQLYGDLKRHDMGPDLAEPVDEAGTGASVFLTRNLWGAGSTAPYLHDGRATTLTEAILEHGGEGAPSRAAFESLTTAQQKDLLAFLDNLVLAKVASGGS
jgi:cytochrome c553/mono/diheme cytochrome c family protein